MQPASIDTIKQELKQRTPKQVLDILLHLARFKKENKELLTYLLFEATDNEAYVRQVKEEITDALHQIDGLPAYQYKKQFRKMQRKLGKPVKYMNNKSATIELYMHVIEQISADRKTSFIRAFLDKVAEQYIRKIEKILPAVPEDLAGDIARRIQQFR